MSGPGGTTLIFLSTFPLRGTSERRRRGDVLCGISIHVPLAGNVRFPQLDRPPPPHFYPRSPCGERQSGLRGRLRTWNISIHVPLAGNVERGGDGDAGGDDFYPRSPCGDRPPSLDCVTVMRGISIHVPLAGNVITVIVSQLGYAEDFYPRSPCGERL